MAQHEDTEEDQQKSGDEAVGESQSSELAPSGEVPDRLGGEEPAVERFDSPPFAPPAEAAEEAVPDEAAPAGGPPVEDAVPATPPPMHEPVPPPPTTDFTPPMETPAPALATPPDGAAPPTTAEPAAESLLGSTTTEPAPSPQEALAPEAQRPTEATAPSLADADEAPPPPLDEAVVPVPPDDEGPAPTQAGRRLLPILASVAVLGLVAFLLVRGSSEKEDPAADNRAAQGRAAPPKDFATHRDDGAGFTLQHPKSWKLLAGPDPEGAVTTLQAGKLLQRAVFSAGGVDGLKVQVVRLETPVTSANVADVKAFTDAVFEELTKETRALNVRQTSLTINGMPAYYYLYTFKDTESGQDGAHARYFVFEGRNMYILIFQALPSDGFDRLAPVFDQVAESFRTNPEIAK